MWLKPGPKRKPKRIQLAAHRYFAVSKKFACNILYDRGASEPAPSRGGRIPMLVGGVRGVVLFQRFRRT